MRLLFISAFLFVVSIQDAFAQTGLKAYVFIAEECPICNYLGKNLKQTSEKYEGQVEFIAVFPQKISNIKTASLFKKKYGIENFKIEIDHSQQITSKYGANVTPEVVLVDENDTVLYKGRINDSYASPGRLRHGKIKEDLRMAIDLALQGNKIPKPWPDPIGCFITKKSWVEKS